MCAWNMLLGGGVRSRYNSNIEEVFGHLDRQRIDGYKQSSQMGLVGLASWSAETNWAKGACSVAACSL